MQLTAAKISTRTVAVEDRATARAMAQRLTEATAGTDVQRPGRVAYGQMLRESSPDAAAPQACEREEREARKRYGR